VNALSIADFSVTYRTDGAAVRAVRDVALAVGSDEVLGIVGESGCGKSSLALGMLGLLTNADLSGSISLAGRQLVGADRAALRRLRWRDISLVPQSAMNALSPVIRVGEQIVDVITAHEKTSRRAARARTVDVLRRVGLQPAHYDAFPHELSGGMRQRAVIAMAIVLMPQVVILDEPTTALDVVTQQLVLEQIMELRSEFGFSMVFITHDLPLVMEWSDRIGVMYAGSIVEVARSNDLTTAAQHPYTRMLMDSFPPLFGPRRDLATIPGAPWDLRRRGSGCLFADRCDSTMDICRLESPRFESGVACHLGRAS
jgi:peptide/nickel transport system ATP-binding protein